MIQSLGLGKLISVVVLIVCIVLMAVRGSLDMTLALIAATDAAIILL